MRKTIVILTALFGLLLLGAGYIYATFELFSPAKISTTFSTPVTFQPVKQNELFSCYRAAQQVAPLQQHEIRLLVWNIHKGEDQGWQPMLTEMASAADFVLLQEATNQQQLPQLLSPYFGNSLFVSAFSYQGRESGVNLLSKITPGFYCAGSENEPWIRIPKVGLAAYYPLLSGQSLLIVNLHLVNFEWTPTNYKKQITPLIELIGQHQGPIILAGDFNSWNSGRINLIEKLARENQLQAVQFIPDYRLKFVGNPLDHVFVRGIRVQTATTIETGASDHNPLLLNLGLE